LIALVLAVVVSAVFLVWRTHKNGVHIPPSPLTSPLRRPTSFAPFSPLPSPSPTMTATATRQAQVVPPTGTPAVNAATLEAIRAAHPTATLPTPSGMRWPYISPDTWRSWSLWLFAAALALTYIGRRLRQNQ
jgi:hypothetical protein